ncbi:hypothetical protein [Mucilaginibacter antarcticus]|uniref:hypothetical protein n=1 Tax=Mucilaginibacter antarcticus TaxID=1855725 RepID=UPI00362BD0E6
MRLNICIFILTICQSGYGNQTKQSDQTRPLPFSSVEIKKTINGAICDSCRVDNFLHAEPDFSYVVIGTGHTPNRFSPLLQKIKAAYANDGLNTAIHLISTKEIDIAFLPNAVRQTGKMVQLYRNFGGDEYSNLEFEAAQNGKVIEQSTQLSTLGKIENYIIFGRKMIGDQTVSVRWPQTYHAGHYQLAVNDTLKVTIRNINTKRVVKVIIFIRPRIWLPTFGIIS